MAACRMKPIILLGEARGANEEKINSSFVGASGIELLRMLDEAGVISLTKDDREFIFKFWNSADPTATRQGMRSLPFAVPKPRASLATRLS
jgi:uracil-DNA glycosylase